MADPRPGGLDQLAPEVRARLLALQAKVEKVRRRTGAQTVVIDRVNYDGSHTAPKPDKSR